MIVWDLDETLIHTREANRVAYETVGVRDLPEDFHTRHWTEWCTPEQHREKGIIIGGLLRQHSRPTPLYNIWRRCGGIVVTAASEEVQQAVLLLYGISARTLLPDERVQWLRDNESMITDASVYADDSIRMIERVRGETRWPVLHARF